MIHKTNVKTLFFSINWQRIFAMSHRIVLVHDVRNEVEPELSSVFASIGMSFFYQFYHWKNRNDFVCYQPDSFKWWLRHLRWTWGQWNVYDYLDILLNPLRKPIIANLYWQCAFLYRPIPLKTPGICICFLASMPFNFIDLISLKPVNKWKIFCVITLRLHCSNISPIPSDIIVARARSTLPPCSHSRSTFNTCLSKVNKLY